MQDKQNLPFTYFFLDDLLPDSFAMPANLTFYDLFSSFSGESLQKIIKKAAERPTKTSKEVREDIFENILREVTPAEFEEFENFFKDLQSVTDYKQLFSPKFIGNSVNASNNHTEGNNLIEWMFSGSGRVDACFIQKDDLKYVFIWDVRKSNHGQTRDTHLHEQRRKVAKIIIDAFKGKNGVDPEGILARGLFAHHREQLEAIKTLEAQYMCLLTTIEELLIMQNSSHDKAALFDIEYRKCCAEIGEKELKKYIEEQFKAGNVKSYQRELMDKLLTFDYSDGTKLDVLEASFAKINIAKKEMNSFLNIVSIRWNENENYSDIENKKMILECYRLFHKIPLSHLYIFDDMIDDLSEDVADDKFKKRLKSLATGLIRLRKNAQTNPLLISFAEVEEIFTKARSSNGQESIGSVPMQAISNIQSDKIYEHFLKIPLDKISLPSNIDLITKAFVKMIVEEGSVLSVYEVNKTGHLARNTLAFLAQDAGEDLITLFKKVVENQEVQKLILKQAPFLESYLKKLDGSELPSLERLNTVCEYIHLYLNQGWTDWYEEAEKELRRMSPKEIEFFRFYLSNVYGMSSEHKEVVEFIYTELDLIHQEKVISQNEKELLAQKKLKQERMSSIEVIENKQEALEIVFEDFLFDMEDEEIQKQLEEVCDSLVGKQLSELAKLKTPLGAFIRDYAKYKNQKKSKKNPITFKDVIQKAIIRDMEEKTKVLQDILDRFIENPDDKTIRGNLNLLCMNFKDTDVDYFLARWMQHAEQYPLHLAFVQEWKKSSYAKAEKMIAEAVHSARESRIESTLTKYVIALQTTDKKAFDNLARQILSLKDEDFKFFIENENQNGSQQQKTIKSAFFEEAKDIRDRNPKKIVDLIVKALISAKRRTAFQNALNDFFEDTYDENKRAAFISATIDMERGDFDFFLQNRQSDSIFTTAFEKLKQQMVRRKVEKIPDIVDSTVRKYHFDNCFFGYVSAHKLNEVVVGSCIETFLVLSSEEQQEILQERNSNAVFSAFFSQLNHMKKDPMTEEAVSDMARFLVKNKWEFEFYRAIYVDAHDMKQRDLIEDTYDDEALILARIGGLTHKQLLELATKEQYVKMPPLVSTTLRTEAFNCFYHYFTEHRKDKNVQNDLAHICSSLTLSDVKSIATHLPDRPLSETADFILGIIDCIRNNKDTRSVKREKCRDFIARMENGPKREQISMTAFERIFEM